MTTKRTRKELQGLFKQGAMPSGTDFSDFIYSCINLKEDGLEKPVGTDQPLKITSQGEEENLLDLYSKSNEWTYRMNQLSSEGEPGLNFKIPAGNSRLFIEGSTGNIGINTDAPKAKLHIKQTDNSDALRIEDTDKDATPFVIDSEGKVGIGVPEPKESLDVDGNVRLSKDKKVIFEDNGSINSADNNHGVFFRRSENKMELREYGDLIFSPGAKEGKETFKCIMTSEGNLGIGVKTPRSKLDIGYVKDGAIGAVFGRQQEGDTENEGTFLGVKGYETQNKKYGGKGFSIEHSFYGHTNSSVNFFRGGNKEGGFLTFSTNKNEEKMRISSDGNVGIGTSEPKSKLDVNGSLNITDSANISKGLHVDEIYFGSNVRQMINLWKDKYGIGIQNSTQYFRTDKHFAWYKGGSHNDNELNSGGGNTLMVIKDGNVGIGTDNPGVKLDVNGDLNINGKVKCANLKIKWGPIQDSGFVNDWDGVMDFKVPDNHVVVGMYSKHDNHREDRRFRIYYRSITFE